VRSLRRTRDAWLRSSGAMPPRRWHARMAMKARSAGVYSIACMRIGSTHSAFTVGRMGGEVPCW
jgi:hypothetical protein